MMIGESPQLRLIAKILAWPRPPELQRQIAPDLDKNGVIVFLALPAVAVRTLIPFTATTADIARELDHAAFKVFHANDREFREPRDLGPFVPVLDKPLDCGAP